MFFHVNFVNLFDIHMIFLENFFFSMMSVSYWNPVENQFENPTTGSLAEDLLWEFLGATPLKSEWNPMEHQFEDPTRISLSWKPIVSSGNAFRQSYLGKSCRVFFSEWNHIEIQLAISMICIWFVIFWDFHMMFRRLSYRMFIWCCLWFAYDFTRIVIWCY